MSTLGRPGRRPGVGQAQFGSHRAGSHLTRTTRRAHSARRPSIGWPDPESLTRLAAAEPATWPPPLLVSRAVQPPQRTVPPALGHFRLRLEQPAQVVGQVRRAGAAAGPAPRQPAG